MISFVKKMWQKYAVGDLATERSESFASSDSSRSSNLSDAPENKKSEHIKKYIATLLTIYEDKDPQRSQSQLDKIQEAKVQLKQDLRLDNDHANKTNVDNILDRLEKKVKRKMSFLPSISIFRKGRDKELKPSDKELKPSDKELKPSDNQTVKLLEATSFKIDRRIFAPKLTKLGNAISERVKINENRIHLNTKTSGRTK